MSSSGNVQASQDETPSGARLDRECGYYSELSCAKDVADFKRRVENIVKRLGFGEYAFVRLASMENSRELISIEPDLIDAYDRAGLYEYDLAKEQAANHARPFFRSTINEEISRSSLSLDEYRRCMSEADKLFKSFSYYDFYNTPVEAKDGNGHVVLSVAQRGLYPAALRRKVKECVLDLQLLCEAIDVVSITKFGDELIGREDQVSRAIKINPRPLEILDMLANNDLKITEVAAHLGINVVTANRHLQAARKAFGVRTNQAAIKQSILNKLIEYKE